MEIPELAQKIIAKTVGADHKVIGYYLLNINHPVIRELKLRYCQMAKINPSDPMSDEQRIAFELWVIQPKAREMIEKIIERGSENG